MQSLERGLDVIRALSLPGAGRTLSEVARDTGLTRASARRFLLTLEELGYVRSDDRRFVLTPRVLELGYAFLSSLTLPQIAQPHLRELVERVHESSSVSVLDGDEIVYVAREPTQRIMTVAISVGTRFPAHATSMGRVLLAGLPVPALESFLQFARKHRDVYRIIDEAEFVEPSAYREHYETTATRIAARLIAARGKGEIGRDYSDDELEMLAWALMGANVFLGLRYAVWSSADPAEVAAATGKLLRSGLKA